jgi:glutaredoxin 2
MTKEQELMQYLHKKVFDPILNSSSASPEIKSGVNLTIARMNRLSAEKMVQYFWSALATENAIKFSKRMKTEGLTRFEDVMEEFRDKFNDEWLRFRI